VITNVNTPRLTPLYWQGDALLPLERMEPLDETASGTLTILHTNDLHSSVDARTQFGGLARIASTIETERAVEPTLVVDGGDSVFGGGTWWCAVDAGATSRLLAAAGYDLAAIGNHDLERGPRSLRELITAGRRLVSTNLQFADEDLQQAIAPAYIVELEGLRIGMLGLTTTMTVRLVPRSVLAGVTFLDARASVLRAASALSPLVHSIVILSHLGFKTEDFSDTDLIPSIKSSKVAAILGGHSHEALSPAPVIDGIVVCNAGAHGVNVNRLTLTRSALGSISVQARLLPQDETVPESAKFLAVRGDELARLQPLRDERVVLPTLPGADRQLQLLVAAVRASGKATVGAIAMIGRLYMLNPLPDADSVSHLEVMTAYPNAEQLMEISIDGGRLKELIRNLSGVNFFLGAAPVLLATGDDVVAEDLEESRTYNVVMSELSAEGGLGWTALQDLDVKARPLAVTCADLVWSYLSSPVPA